MIPVTNAAGTVKTVDGARRLANVGLLEEIVIGSYTVDPRDGNSGSVYTSVQRQGEHRFALNALGLPNPGSLYIDKHSASFMDLGKLIVVSIAGETPEEYATCAVRARWAHAIEINFGCPNRWIEGRQARIGSFDLRFIDEVMRVVNRKLLIAAHTSGRPIPAIRVKLSPFSDPYAFEQTVKMLWKEYTGCFVLSNTFPNGWFTGALSTPYGGVSGVAMMPIVLGQVRQARALLPQAKIIAAGGVRHGDDIKHYEAAGANSVQVASRFLDGDENPDVFVNLVAGQT